MLKIVFVRQLQIASLILLLVLALLAEGNAAASELIPIHGVVLTQHQSSITMNLDRVPEMVQGGRTIVHLAAYQKLAPNTEIDGFFDPRHAGLSEIYKTQRYIAGLPDEDIHRQLQVNDLLPDLHFIDQTGSLVTLRALRGKTLILSFFYTHCPDREICPAISGRFAYLQSRINSDRVQLLEITVDPRNDSSKRLAAYGHQFGADPSTWHLLTAEQHSIADSLALFGLSNLESNPGDFVHDDVLAFINDQGRLEQTITTAGWSPDDVLATIAHMNGEQGTSNWFRRMELESVAKLVSACGGSTTAAIAIMDSIIFVLGVVILGSLLAWFAKRIWS